MYIRKGLKRQDKQVASYRRKSGIRIQVNESNAQKTEIMLISNTYNDHNIELIMDNTILQIVNSHKHLGVVLSSNNVWTKHIDTIIQGGYKVRKEPSLAKRCEKSGKDAKRDIFHEIAGNVM